MNQLIPLLFAVAGLSIGIAGCGHYPAVIHSARDIARTSSSEYMIVLGNLPLEDWPRIQKFTALEHFRVTRDAAAKVTDRHIQALARLKLPKLKQMSLAHCRNVTDVGILSLTNVTSIEGLQLTGTGITDRGLQILVAGLPKVSGINAINCRSLTTIGFHALKDSATIKSVGLSVDPLSQTQIENIIENVSNVTWWTISDPRHQLNHSSLKTLGESRKITIQVVDEHNRVTEITTAA